MGVIGSLIQQVLMRGSALLLLKRDIKGLLVGSMCSSGREGAFPKCGGGVRAGKRMKAAVSQ